MILGQDIWALDSGSLPWRCKGFSYNCKKNNHECWRQVPIQAGVSFNMLDAASTCVWAVDFEYHVYLFVKECDIPIRFQDYKFRFERWFLGRGWKTVERDDESPKRNLSHHWTADSVWRIDRNIDGVPTDRDGWQYASGFNSVFSNQETQTKVVRRKRLAKYYTYNKMGNFAKITADEEIKFMDVAAGGTMLTGSENWPICVWGVSKECKVYFRTNISNINPEGDRWKEVCQPDFSLAKLSVGPRGQLWGITTQGELITRAGIDSDNLTGTEWLEISISIPGMQDIYPTALTVSADSVWMIDCKGRVFFHKGADLYVHNTLLLTDRHDTRSTSKWVHMVMEPDNIINFKSLSCGPENQVWGLDNEDKIFNRTDVSITQISGQNWQLIEDPKLKNGDVGVDSDPDSDQELNSTLPPCMPFSSPLRRDSSFLTAKSMSSQYTLPVDPNYLPKYAMDEPDRYSYDEGSVDSKNLCEPDDLFHDSDSDVLEEPSEHSLTSSLGVHYWKMISCGGCQGVGVKRDDVNLKQAELSKVQIAVIKQSRDSILDKLREQSMKIRSKLFDNYNELVDDGGFKLKSNAKIEMDGASKNATVYLSKNIPHGHLRFRIYTPGAASLDMGEDDQRRLGRRGRMLQYEPTVMINQTSTIEQVEQVPLVNLFGIKRISPNVKQHTLLLFTAKRSYQLTFERDTDCNNWFDRVNEYVRSVHEIPDVPPNQSVWALSGDGTVYFSPPAPSCVTNHSKRAWLPIEGNFVQIAAGPRSIVWGVAPDNNLYCFTRGYGGGSHHMGENLENFSVQRHFQCTENERFKLVGFQFQPCSGRDNRSNWVDDLGNTIESQNQYRLPLSSWRWIGDWSVKNLIDSDPDGWYYAKNFHSPFSANPGRGARKRHCVRLAQMNCTAPWKKIPVNLVKIARITLEPYCFKSGDELVVAWALCTNGSLLYRHGVTPNKPQGEDWVHVDIDHPLVDVSLDAFCNLWAVCSDGSAYFRMGISEQVPIGNRWMHIVKPERDHLVKIAAGKYAVWALGSTGNCYIRTKISSIREYGQSWSLVNSEPMCSISVSGSDQVFGITEVNRAVVSRDGVSGDKLKGDKWSRVVQDVWSNICITATTQQHHWDQIDELTSMAMTRYRTQIWVKLRENRLKDTRWMDYHRFCPQIFPGDRVFIRGSDGTWSRNIIDHIGTDRALKVRVPGLFTTTYESKAKNDVIRDEPPHPTHVAVGTEILAKLSYLSNKYSPCVVKSIDHRRGKLMIEAGSQYDIHEVRIPDAQLNSDIYFLDGKRKHSVTNDEFGREIVI
ncbi:tectonin beta-propeller repeat-containing protein 1-like isoform X2 [Bolinopsis microptera]|uniref:tectonin beta-propeller repeat-containing protein 1-like isoform X2 n=1 Tax=Bolinopsis microptera TaxID=2820187 RepID=UPI003078BDFE